MCSHGRWNVTSLRRSLVSSEGDALHARRDHASPRGHSRGDFGRDLLLRRRALGCKAVVQIIQSSLSSCGLVAGVVGGVEPDADIDPRHAGAADSQNVDEPAQRRTPSGLRLRRIVSAIERDWVPPLVGRGRGGWGSRSPNCGPRSDRTSARSLSTSESSAARRINVHVYCSLFCPLVGSVAPPVAAPNRPSPWENDTISRRTAKPP